MGFSVSAKNLMLDALGIDTASLHTGDPGDAGANEVTGGSYARKAITYNAASGGNLDSSTVPLFDVPAGVTITHSGYWDGSVFRSGGPLTAAETYGSGGTYTLNDSDQNLNS